MINKVKLIAGIIAEGLRLYGGIPRRFKLTVDNEWEARREQEAKKLAAKYGLEPLANLTPIDPAHKYIHLNHRYNCDGSEHQTSCVIAIDHAKRQIDYSRSSSWLFDKEHKGSGMIGVALISAPIALFLSPFLIGANLYYRAKESYWGVSRHSISVFKTISAELDRATRALLLEAMINSWRYEKKMTRKVSLEEAKALLSGCELREYRMSREKDMFGIEVRSFYWFDEGGENVANGNIYGDSERDINVLGSTFIDGEADILSGCYRVRKVYNSKAELVDESSKAGN